MSLQDTTSANERLDAATKKLGTSAHRKGMGEILAIIAESNSVLASSNTTLAEANANLTASVKAWTKQASKVQKALFGLTCVLALGAAVQIMDIIKSW